MQNYEDLYNNLNKEFLYLKGLFMIQKNLGKMRGKKVKLVINNLPNLWKLFSYKELVKM